MSTARIFKYDKGAGKPVLNFQKQTSVTESFEKFSEQERNSINKYLSTLKSTKNDPEKVHKIFKDLNPEVIKFAQNTDKGSLTIENLNKHLAKSAKSANLAAVGMQALSAGANLGANILLSMAVSGVATFFDDLIHAEERAVEAGKRAQENIQAVGESYRSQTNSAGQLASRYDELSRSMAKNGTAHPGAAEYEEFLQVSSQLAELYPELVSGYDASGNAILNFGNRAETASGKIAELAQQQRKLTNAEIGSSLDDLYKGITVSAKESEKVLGDYRDELERLEGIEAADILSGVHSMFHDGNATFSIDNSLDYADEYMDKLEQAFENAGLNSGEHFEVIKNSYTDTYDLNAFHLTDEQIERVEQELETQFEGLSGEIQTDIAEANSKISSELLKQKQLYAPLAASMFDWVTTTDDFAVLDGDTQNLVRSALSKIDYSQMVFDSDGNRKDMDQLKSDLMDGLVHVFSDPSLDGTVKEAYKSLFSLDASTLSAGEYQKSVDELIEQIVGSGDEFKDKRNQFKLQFGFAVEDENGNPIDSQDALIKEISEKTGIGSSQLESLTGRQLEVAYQLIANADGNLADVNLNNMDGLKSAVENEMKKEDLSIDVLSGNYATLSNEIQAVNSLIAGQNTGQSLSVDAYNSLISQSGEYGSALEYVNGQMQLNADALRAIRQERIQAAIAQNEEARALQMADYSKNCEEIDNLSAKLEGMANGPAADGIRSQIEAFEQENDAIVLTCDKLDLMNAALLEATGSYQAWKEAQNASESGDMFDDTIRAMDNINDVFEEGDDFGKIGTKKYQASVEFLVPESVSSEGQEAIQNYMEELRGYLNFDENGDFDGLNQNAFFETAVNEGLMKLDESGESYLLAGEMTMKNFAEGMNMSLPMVQAIFGELAEYGLDFQWKNDTPSVETEIRDTEEPINMLKVEADTTKCDAQIKELEMKLDELRNERVSIPVFIQPLFSIPSFRSGNNSGASSGNSKTSSKKGSSKAAGSLGTKTGETALVGELGREIVVDSRTGKWHTVGDNGAEFAYIPAGSIVFNHAQSEALLGKGQVGSRGSALAGGTGPLDWISRAAARSSDSGNARMEIASLSAAALSGDMASAAASAEEFNKAMNWAEVRLDRIDNLFSWLKKDIEDTADNLSYAQTIGGLNDAIQAGSDYARVLNEAAAGYLHYAQSIGLASEYVTRIQNGAMDIQSIQDETLKKQIDEYTKWYDKAVSCYEKVRNLNTEIRKMQLQKLDAVVDWADFRIDYQDALGKRMQAYMELSEASGVDNHESQYRYMIDRQATTKGKLEDKLSNLKREFQGLMDRGVIHQYSEEWHKWMSDIYGIEAAIVDTESAMEKLRKESRELDWKKFERGIDALSQMDDELSAISGLYEDSMLFNENGSLTSSGRSAVAIYGQQAELAAVKAVQYSQALVKLDKELRNGSLSQLEYNEQVSEFTKRQQDAAKEVKAYRDKLISLITDGIDRETDAYVKLNDAKKEALNTQKEADSYKKQLAEKSSAVSVLESEYASLLGVSGRSAQARRDQLLKEIDDAKAELLEFQQDHALEEQLKYLDQDSESFKTAQDSRAELLKTDLDAQNLAISELLSDTVIHSDEILSDIKLMTKNYGMELGDALSLPWENASSAMKEYLVILNSMGIGIGNVNAGAPYRPTYNQSIGTSNYSYAPGSVNSFKEDEAWKAIQHALAVGGGKRYASGARHVPEGFHLTNESGLEAILTKEGLLTPFVGSGTVFNEKATDVLYRFSNAPETYLKKFLKPVNLSAVLPSVSPVTLHYDSLVTVKGDVIEDTIPSLSQVVANAVPAVKQDLQRELKLLGKTVNLYR